MGHAPDPAMLAALQPAAPHGEGDNYNPLDDPPPVSHCRPQACNQAPPTNQIGHYLPVWKDRLEAATVECRTVHALMNPWPKMQMDLENSIMDSLTIVVMQWDQHSVHFEPGKYLHHLNGHTDLSSLAFGLRRRYTWLRWYVNPPYVHWTLTRCSYMKTCQHGNLR